MLRVGSVHAMYPCPLSLSSPLLSSMPHLWVQGLENLPEALVRRLSLLPTGGEALPAAGRAGRRGAQQLLGRRLAPAGCQARPA